MCWECFCCARFSESLNARVWIIDGFLSWRMVWHINTECLEDWHWKPKMTTPTTNRPTDQPATQQSAPRPTNQLSIYHLINKLNHNQFFIFYVVYRTVLYVRFNKHRHRNLTALNETLFLSLCVFRYPPEFTCTNNCWVYPTKWQQNRTFPKSLSHKHRSTWK